MTFPWLIGKFPVKHCSHQVNGAIESVFLKNISYLFPDDGFMQSIFTGTENELSWQHILDPKRKKKSHFSHYHFFTNNFMQNSKIKIKSPGFKF